MVTLQKPSLRHADAFLQSVRRSRKLHTGFVCPPADLDGYRRYVNALRSERRESFLVVVEGTDKLVGVVNVNEIVRGAFQSAYLGYYAFTPHAGHGLMRQGMHKVISYCFGELKLHRVEANIQPDNKRSISLVTGLGFRNEGFSPRYLKVCGRWRDHERWALLSEDWRRRGGLATKREAGNFRY